MKTILIGLACALAFASSSEAALVDRGGGMIYDTTLNVTWLADMNFAATSGYAARGTPYNSLYDTDAIWSDGSMGWNAALHWAADLNYGGYDDWRLPTLDRPGGPGQPGGPGSDCIYSRCVNGELGHLFSVDLGNGLISIFDQSGDTEEQKANLALFGNIQNELLWYGNESIAYPDQAFFYAPLFGVESRRPKRDMAHAMAVRDGDVAAAVPEPATVALIASALLGSAASRKRRRTATSYRR
jgi:PEP-CTERM motif